MTDDLSRAAWRKSKHSGDATNGCVEVAPLHERAAIGVRDSKDPSGPALVFSPDAWDALLGSLR